MKKKAVIIPCAGKGTRLGIPHAKELFPIESNKVLIDYCFDILYPIRNDIRIIIIISTEKMNLINYLNKYANDFEIAFIYQKSTKPELLGAIESAKDLFLEYNLLMLPDIRIFDNSTTDKIIKIFNIVQKSKVVFGAVKSNDIDKLSKMGALKTSECFLIDLVDKPQTNIEKFDSYWILIAWEDLFTKDFLNALKYVYNNNSDKDVFNKTIFNKSPVVFFKDALDMGVWNNIYSIFKSC